MVIYFKTHISKEDASKLLTYTQDLTFFNTNESSCYINIAVYEQEKRDFIHKLFPHYSPYIKSLLDTKREEVIENFRDYLLKAASMSNFGDFRHKNYPICFPERLYTTYGIKTLDESKKQQGKTISRKELSLMLQYPLVRLRAAAVMKGFPMAKTENKSQAEIISMILDNANVDKTDLRDLISAKSEVVLNLQKSGQFKDIESVRENMK